MPIGQMFSVLGTVVDSDWCDGVATISEQQRLPLSFSSLTFFALSVPSDNPQPYEKSKISVDVGLGFQNAVQVKCVCVLSGNCDCSSSPSSDQGNEWCVWRTIIRVIAKAAAAWAELGQCKGAVCNVIAHSTDFGIAHSFAS